ncbi:hypothetical protein HK096_002373 [Nowakowskiella sp. JEL0078]|nr:hypothetical protein HK096_002373 [Nowakowskiella sp. JEL0078]
MRFRTKITNTPVFVPLVQSLEKISKLWILRLTPRKIHTIIPKNSSSNSAENGHIQVWGEINVDSIFDEYTLTSNNNNEICLELNGENFARALKSSIPTGNLSSGQASWTSGVDMRLSTIDKQPVLIISLTGHSRAGGDVDLIQYVPVRVLSVSEQEELKEPLIADPQARKYHEYLLFFLKLSGKQERMKAMSGFLTVSANLNGQLVLKIKTDKVRVETTYIGLTNPEIAQTQVGDSQHANRNRDPLQFAEVRVDIKDFLRFVHSHQMNPVTVVCCILEGFGLAFYVFLGTDGEDTAGTLVYYIPQRKE